MISDAEKAGKMSDHKRTIPRKNKLDVLDLIGGSGPWQRRIFLIIMFVGIPSASHNLSMSFLAPNLDHWCAKPAEAANFSDEQWRKISLPLDDKQCSRYEIVNLTRSSQEVNDESFEYSIVVCDAWDYDNTLYSSTILSKWDLVCDRQWLVSMSKSAFVAGTVVAVTLFGHIADKFGRRPVIAASSFIAIFSSILCAFSTSFTMFTITRFLIALGVEGCYTTTFVLLMEVIGPDLRSIFGIAVQFGWCLGFVSLPAIAWLIRDWFWIQIALTALCAIFSAIWWILPESPRWLLAQGKLKDAQQVICRAANENGKHYSDIETTLKKVMNKAHEVHGEEGSNRNVLDLLNTPGLWQITINIYFVWFVNGFVYYGLSYNTNDLAGNPFVNFALSGAVEFPAYFFSIFAIRSLGRRNPLVWSMVIGGLACLLSYFIPEDPWWLSVTISMTGKFCITFSFAILYVFTAELFPTVLRNVGLGSASMCSRVASIVAPFVRELGVATHPVVPQIIFGVLAVISGVLVLLLPETSNYTVPDTIQEAAEVSKRKRKKPTMLNGYDGVVTWSVQDATSADQAPTTRAELSRSSKP